MAKEKEIWKEVANFPEYEVSTLGRLRKRKDPKIYGLDQWRVITLTPSTDGYVRYMLYKTSSTRRIVSALRLVLETFNPCEDMLSMEADHIDGNKMNNALSNGRWISHRENCINRIVAKPKSYNRGVWIIYEDDTVEYYRKRSDMPIPLNTLSHMLVGGNNYSNSSKKFGVKACFYEDEIPERYKQLISTLLDEANDNRLF